MTLGVELVGGVDDWWRWLTEKQCEQIVEEMRRQCLELEDDERPV